MAKLYDLYMLVGDYGYRTESRVLYIGNSTTPRQVLFCCQEHPCACGSSCDFCPCHQFLSTGLESNSCRVSLTVVASSFNFFQLFQVYHGTVYHQVNCQFHPIFNSRRSTAIVEMSKVLFRRRWRKSWTEFCTSLPLDQLSMGCCS